MGPDPHPRLYFLLCGRTTFTIVLGRDISLEFFDSFNTVKKKSTANVEEDQMCGVNAAHEGREGISRRERKKS